MKGTQTVQMVDFIQGNNFKAFEKNGNITSLSSWDKFNAFKLLFPVTGFIKGTIQTHRFNFSF